MEEKKKHWESIFWKELADKDPRQIARTALADYDETGCYTLSSLGRKIRVCPADRVVESDDPVLSDYSEFQLLIVTYLLGAQNIEPTGEMVSEKDLQGGSTFFRGPHAMPSAALEKAFGKRGDLFREKGLQLGAREANFGDIALTFPVLPRVELTIILWLGDEEFPPRVTFLMDRSVETHLPLDVIGAMGIVVTRRLLDLT